MFRTSDLHIQNIHPNRRFLLRVSLCARTEYFFLKTRKIFRAQIYMKTTGVKWPYKQWNAGWFRRHGTIWRLRASAPHYNNIYKYMYILFKRRVFNPMNNHPCPANTNRCLETCSHVTHGSHHSRWGFFLDAITCIQIRELVI